MTGWAAGERREGQVCRQVYLSKVLLQGGGGAGEGRDRGEEEDGMDLGQRKVCPCGRHIAHKFESGWEVGVIKAFDKKGLHACKFSVKYKDDPNWWTHSLLREGYGKDKHWVLLGLPSRDFA